MSTSTAPHDPTDRAWVFVLPGAMTLLRLLILIVAGWLVWRLVRGWLRSKRHRPPSPPFTHMVRCIHCGMHLPQRDALKKGDLWYCSRAHRDAQNDD